MKRLIPGRDMLNKGRFDAFTDGVFAVAITLMVLEIKLPDRAGDDLEMRHYLGTLGVPLMAYALSFATVGLIWINHHATFAPVRHVNRTTNALNLVLLALVCFVPFPTALLSRFGPLPSSTAFYGATLTAMSVAYFAVWQYAVRSDPEAPPVPRAVMVRGGIGTLVYLAGTLLAFWEPRAAIWVFVGVAVYYALPGLFNLRPIDPIAKRDL